MKIKIATDDPQSMAQSGDSILRSLQNTDFSLSDLLVRESIQNALDATLEDATSTKVNYTLKSFNSEKLISQLEGIEAPLREKFTGQEDFLAISDMNTVGLTGDYKATNPDGNFQKLVFSIGKNQEADGAGGSWGMGKTSYFRIGCGIVFYYTRIKVGNTYEERLIGSLIESPKKANRLLRDSSRGIAWWGRYEGDDQRIFPITDHQEIKTFMDIFGLETYQNDETGTTIIIPFLHKSFEPPRGDDGAILPWEVSRKSSLKMAIQRWYAPRLMNTTALSKSRPLVCYFNNSLIGLNMEPTFAIMNSLYTAALTGKTDNPDITISDIKLPRMAMANNNEPVGRVAFMLPDAEALQMIAPDNLVSPMAYITSNPDDKDDIRKIVAFTRKPGMVVKYDIDSSWAEGVNTNGRHLLAFFVPNSSGRLHNSYQELGLKTVEQYLRKGEKADHADWFDQAKFTLIKRIKRYVAQALKDQVNDDGKDHKTHASDRLSRRFGRILLPSAKYGKSGSRNKPKDPPTGGNIIRNRKVDISVTGSSFLDANHIKLEFTSFIKDDAQILVLVRSQDNRMDIKKWHNTLGEIKFPVDIVDVEWKEDYDFTGEINSDGTVSIKNAAPVVAQGTLTLKLSSSKYQTVLSIRQMEGEK